VSGGKSDKATSRKRQFLVHIDANLIRRIKILAIDRDVTASSLVEEAMLIYLAAAKAAINGKSGDKP
jgi:hypothetical protein